MNSRFISVIIAAVLGLVILGISSFLTVVAPPIYAALLLSLPTSLIIIAIAVTSSKKDRNYNAKKFCSLLTISSITYMALSISTIIWSVLCNYSKLKTKEPMTRIWGGFGLSMIFFVVVCIVLLVLNYKVPKVSKLFSTPERVEDVDTGDVNDVVEFGKARDVSKEKPLLPNN